MAKLLLLFWCSVHVYKKTNIQLSFPLFVNLSIVHLVWKNYLEQGVGDELREGEGDVDAAQDRRVEGGQRWRQNCDGFLAPQLWVENHREMFPVVSYDCKIYCKLCQYGLRNILKSGFKPTFVWTKIFIASSKVVLCLVLLFCAILRLIAISSGFSTYLPNTLVGRESNNGFYSVVMGWEIQSKKCLQYPFMTIHTFSLSRTFWTFHYFCSL